MLKSKTSDFQNTEFTLPYTGASFLSTYFATLIKGLRLSLKYRANFISMMIQSVAFIGVMIMFANAYSFNLSNPLSLQQTVVFYLGGLLIIFYDSVALWQPLNTVTVDLYNGTLEYIYSTPTSRVAYYLGSVSSAAVFSSIFVIPLLGFVLVYTSLSVGNLLMILLVLFMTILTLSAFGVMFGLLAILYKNVGNVSNVLGTFFTFFSGLFVPVTVLPLQLQAISYVLPYTWGIDLIRHYSIGGVWVTIAPIQLMWFFLGLMTILYWITTKFLLTKVEKRAKREGLHLL